MAFNGNEGDFVALAQAAEWTANYRDANPNQTRAHFFGINKLKEILEQPGCMGIRAYYAINDAGEKQLVLVGADGDGNDMLSGGKILDFSFPCPTECDSASPLNNNN